MLFSPIFDVWNHVKNTWFHTFYRKKRTCTLLLTDAVGEEALLMQYWESEV